MDLSGISSDRLGQLLDAPEVAVDGVRSAIEQLDEILDELLSQAGVPDSDNPSSSDRTPRVPDGIARLLQRADDVVDKLMKQMNIPDDDADDK